MFGDNVTDTFTRNLYSMTCTDMEALECQKMLEIWTGS